MRHQRMSTNLGSCGALETLGDPAVVPKAWGLSGNMCYPGHVYSHLLLTLCKRFVCQGVVTDLDTINSRCCQPTNILCSRDGNHKEACVGTWVPILLFFQMPNLSQLTGMTSLPDMRFGSSQDRSCHTESLSTQSVYVQDRDFFIVCTSPVFQVADSSSVSLKELLNH